MALTDKLTAIGNAIRAKTGGTSLIPLVDMPAAIISIDGGAQGQDYTWDQRQTDVKDFISEVTYDPSDYSYSDIEDYVTTTGRYKPVGVAVAIPAAGVLTVTDGNGKGTISFEVTVGNYTVYNIMPNTTGIYTLFNEYGVASSGELKPTGALRMIALNDAANVRDLGGWSCDGGTVKYGKLFRGSRLFIDYNDKIAQGIPATINEDDIKMLHDFLGIQHELDLRYASGEGTVASDEIARGYSLIGKDVGWTHIDGAWYSISEKAKCKAMLDCVMDCAINNIPLYFHCAGGADRTGTLAMFIEALLGVSQSDIDKDYELTCFYSGVSSASQARRRDENDWKGLINAFSSFSGSTIRDRVFRWAVVTLGIPIDKINAFRAAMIDGTPETLTISGLSTYTITKNGSGVSYDNTETSVTQYREYKTVITPDPTKIITGITVTMDGVDITDSVLSGDFVPFGEIQIASNGTVDVSEYAAANVNVSGGGTTRYTVSKTLNNSTASNSSTQATSGDSYADVITPNTGYVISSVAVTMGGVDISSSCVFYQ